MIGAQIPGSPPFHDLPLFMQPEIVTDHIPTTAASLKESGSEHRVQIKNVDMSEEMQERAIELAKVALKQQQSPREVAGIIKKEFDKIYGPTWHCIVGKAFGSFVTHVGP